MKGLATKVFVGMISFALTFIVFLNTYEVVLNKDVPLASSIERSDVQSAINGVVRDLKIKTAVSQNTANSKLGALKTIEVPALNARVQLEEARKINGQWYNRPSYASYIGLNKDSRDATIDYLIYTKQSWRTLPDATRLEVGMDVKLFDEKGSMSIFSVDSVSPRQKAQSLIVSKSERRQIVLIIENPRGEDYVGVSLVQGL